MAGVYSRNCPYLYRGIVESTEDPANLGRCRIRVPSIHGSLVSSVEALPLARPIATIPVKEGRGSFALPDVGDIVWVLFEGGEKSCPVYFGGTYGKGELELDKDSVDFYIEDNTRISYSRKDNSYSIKIGNTQLNLTNEGVQVIGDLNITGNLNVAGHVSVGSLYVEGNTRFNGSVSGLPEIRGDE